MHDTDTLQPQSAPPAPMARMATTATAGSWRYLRRLCIAVVLALAIFNASVAPPAQAEGTFEAPAIVVTTVLIVALTLITMTEPFRRILTTPAGERPSTYDWHKVNIVETTLLLTLTLAVMAPVIRMLAVKRQYAGTAALLVTTAIVLSSPFSIPANTEYAE